MMRNLLSLIALLAFFAPTELIGQKMEVNKFAKVNTANQRSTPQLNQGLTVTCDVDTVQYPLYKGTSYSLLNVHTGNSGQGLYQYYNCPQEMTLYGFAFMGYAPGALDSIDVLIEVYNVTPDSLPADTPLISIPYLLDSNHGTFTLAELTHNVVFPTPLVRTQPYILAIRNLHPQSLGVSLVTTDYTTNDGGGEWLSGVDFNNQPGGNWTRGYDVNVGPNDFDADVLFHPFVGYELKTNFMADTTCMQSPDTVCFTNLTSPIMFDRMYNQYAFLNLPSAGFNWDFGDGAFLSIVDTCHIYAATGPYNVTLYATHFGWTNICSESKTIPIGGPGLPIAGFAANQNGATVNFANQSSGAVTWDWDLGDGATSTIPSPSHFYTSNGSYPVTLIVTNTCGADTITDTIVVNCIRPVASFTYSNSFLSVSFSNTSVGGTTWAWTFGDGGISGAKNPNHVYPAYGAYWVTLIISGNCGSDTISDSVHVILPQSISHWTGPKPNLFPNPSAGKFFLELSGINEDLVCIVNDISGRELFKQLIPSTADRRQETDLSQFENGVYFLSVNGQDKRWVVKVIVGK